MMSLRVCVLVALALLLAAPAALAATPLEVCEAKLEKSIERTQLYYNNWKKEKEKNAKLQEQLDQSEADGATCVEDLEQCNNDVAALQSDVSACQDQQDTMLTYLDDALMSTLLCQNAYEGCTDELVAKETALLAKNQQYIDLVNDVELCDEITNPTPCANYAEPCEVLGTSCFQESIYAPDYLSCQVPAVTVWCEGEGYPGAYIYHEDGGATQVLPDGWGDTLLLSSEQLCQSGPGNEVALYCQGVVDLAPVVTTTIEGLFAFNNFSHVFIEGDWLTGYCMAQGWY